MKSVLCISFKDIVFTLPFKLNFVFIFFFQYPYSDHSCENSLLCIICNWISANTRSYDSIWSTKIQYQLFTNGMLTSESVCVCVLPETIRITIKYTLQHMNVCVLICEYVCCMLINAIFMLQHYCFVLTLHIYVCVGELV